MRVRVAALVLPLVVGLEIACDQNPTATPAGVAEQAAFDEQGSVRKQAPPPGSGLVLDSLTGVTVPLIGHVGDVVINQAVITNFALVENAVGQIVGLEASGIVRLSGDVLGAGVTQDFTTLVSLTSSGAGQCDIITVDLGPIGVDALGLATVDVPEATLTGRGSGAVGSLLCTLGNLLGGLTGGGGVIPGVQGVVRAINNLI